MRGQKTICFKSTDDEGTIVTVQDQKDAKTAAENSALKARERATRDELLASTDHFALVDATLTDAMRTYRQALRDVPHGKASQTHGPQSLRKV